MIMLLEWSVMATWFVMGLIVIMGFGGCATEPQRIVIASDTFCRQVVDDKGKLIVSWVPEDTAETAMGVEKLGARYAKVCGKATNRAR